MDMTHRTSGPRRRLPLLCAIALAALASPACSLRNNAQVTGALPSPDVRERHPIVLTEAPRSLELFPGPGGHLDARQAGDLAAFAADYHANARSVIVAETDGPGGARALAAARAQLARHGVPAGAVRSRPGHGGHLGGGAPLILSFAKLTARVPHECGHWPEDLGMSNARFSATNQPYWNLGCASQANLAAQIADPLDLVRARPEGRIDTIKRMNAIDKIRQGQDPSTAYRTEASQINKGVGN